MFRKGFVILLLAILILLGVGCSNKKVKNPLASLDSKQPDKVLFDRAMDAMQHRKYDVARLSLQTLINTYPDSEYVARAKLGIGDSWYAEGGSAGLAQAENEYKDFITFFPNMPEAAEAQLKVADIHYRQMEKPDRDYTHAKRAEDEYRQVLLQYPDSKLAEQARIKLLEVQEILADREFRIGRFYFMRGSWAAAVARLKTLTDTYPLYSGSDEALFMLGQSMEKELELVRSLRMPEVAKAKLIKQYTDDANAAYSKIITRYPLMPRVDDARARLKALDLAVPTPTQEAIELNKKEIASRGEEPGKFARIWGTIRSPKKPDVSRAAKVGEPTLVDPKPTDAPALIREANEIVKDSAVAKDNKVSVETVKEGSVPESQPVPRSDSPAPDASTEKTEAPPAAPPQVNEAATDGAATQNPATPEKAAATATGTEKKADDKQESTSKPKKKKGIRKIIPF